MTAPPARNPGSSLSILRNGMAAHKRALAAETHGAAARRDPDPSVAAGERKAFATSASSTAESVTPLPERVIYMDTIRGQPYLWVQKDRVLWLGQEYSRICPKCGSVIIVKGAWQVITKMLPTDHDYAYGHCRKTATCGWHGEMILMVASDKKIAK